LIYKIELLLLLLNYCSLLTPCIDCVGAGYVDHRGATLAALVTSGESYSYTRTQHHFF